MSRFTEKEFENKQLTPIYGYWSYPLVPLEEALEPILPLINQLDRYIQVAKENCTYPSEHNLTRDESAALYLYTMEWGDESFYRVLNRALRLEDRSLLKPWFPFLKLFDTTLNKLPSLNKVIWRGVRHDVSKELKENQELTWWSINSCSLSVNVVKDFLDQNSTLFLIEAVNGKEVSNYTNYPNEDEVLLSSGTKLRVVSDTLDHIGGLHIVHLKEVTGKNDKESTLTKTSISEKLPTKNILGNYNLSINLILFIFYFFKEMAYAKLSSVGQSELPRTIKNTVLGMFSNNQIIKKK